MTVFETARLIIRRGDPNDVEFIRELWNDPLVMKYVGFPEGLGMSREEVADRFSAETGELFDRILIITMKDGIRIGNTKIGRINEKGITETDMKIIPAYWGKGYGKEAKKGLCDFIFTHTDAEIVQATPNRENIASIRMQEYAGAKPVDEGIFSFHQKMKMKTCPVPYILYQLNRKDWEKMRLESE